MLLRSPPARPRSPERPRRNPRTLPPCSFPAAELLTRNDYRTGKAQDAKTTSAILAALLAYYTSAQVDALLADYRTASAQKAQTQAAIGALFAP